VFNSIYMCCNQSSSYAAKQNKTLNDTINNDDDDDNNNRLILWHNAASLTRIDRSVVFAGWRQCAPHGYSAYANLRKDLLVCQTDRRTQTTLRYDIRRNSPRSLLWMRCRITITKRQTSPPGASLRQMRMRGNGLCAVCPAMTSSAKPEVLYLLYCYQKRIAPKSQVTYAETFVKWGPVVFETRERRDKHACIQ